MSLQLSLLSSAALLLTLLAVLLASTPAVPPRSAPGKGAGARRLGDVKGNESRGAGGCCATWRDAGARDDLPCPWAQGAPCCRGATGACAECLAAEPIEDSAFGRPCSRLREASRDVRVAVMNVGLLRLNWTEPVVDFVRRKNGPPHARALLKHLDGLRLNGTATMFDLHRRHVLDALRSRGMDADYFLCFDRLPPLQDLGPEVAGAWAFKASSQQHRVQGCVRRLRRLERHCGGRRYTLFVRLRNTFLTLSDIPDLSPAVPSGGGQGCAMVRFAVLHNISGVTNDMASGLGCRSSCSSPSIPTPRGFTVDDVVNVLPRHLLNAFWEQRGGKLRYPAGFSDGGGQAEALLARSAITAGIPLCPLPFRGWPIMARANRIFAKWAFYRGCDFYNSPAKPACPKPVGEPLNALLRSLPQAHWLVAPSAGRKERGPVVCGDDDR